MKPNISKPTAEQESEAESWPTWSKEASEFPWEYDQPETCLILEGDVPSPANPPAGCHFHPRCPERFEGCDAESPTLHDVGDGHCASCRLFSATKAAAAPSN